MEEKREQAGVKVAGGRWEIFCGYSLAVGVEDFHPLCDLRIPTSSRQVSFQRGLEPVACKTLFDNAKGLRHRPSAIWLLQALSQWDTGKEDRVPLSLSGLGVP